MHRLLLDEEPPIEGGEPMRITIFAATVGTVPSPVRPNPQRYDPGDRFFMRHLLAPLARAAFREHYRDLALMEDVLVESGLDWTVVRPPRLTDGPLTTTYRVAHGRNVPGGFRVSRADVAHLMLHAIDRPDTVKEVLGVAS
jgi:hypothetical protein